MGNKYYSANLLDNNKIKKSSSGGAAYALAECVINCNGVVYGVKYSKDFKSAQYIRVDNMEGIEELSGSKYILANKKLINGKSVFQSVFDDLDNNILTLFIGLPCEVTGLYGFIEKKGCLRADKLITVDFICQGPLNPDIQRQYVEFLEKRYKSEIMSFSVRYKNPNWKPVYLYAEFKNGKRHVRKLYDTDFGRAFLIYGRECCYQCRCKGKGHISNITVGDFWGLEPDEIGFDILGTSVVITHNVKGDDFFKRLSNLRIYEVNEKKAIGKNPMYSVSRERHNSFYEFDRLLKLYGLHEAVFKTRTFLSKIKYIIQLLTGQKPY